MLPGGGGGPSSARLGAAGVAGVVLAGGRGRRLGGGSKACVELGGRPLLSYPLAALLGLGLGRVAAVCKRATALPALPEGVRRWEEPDEPRHPAVGIAQALESAGGPVLIVATDMPCVGAEECRRLLEVAGAAGAAGAAESPPAAVVAAADGRLTPVLGVYRPEALPALRAAARAGTSLTGAVEALGPVACELPAVALRGVNTREELEAAERELSAAPAARSRRP